MAMIDRRCRPPSPTTAKDPPVLALLNSPPSRLSNSTDGKNGGETAWALLNKQGRFPILVQDFQPMGGDSAGGGAGGSVHGMGWTNWGSPGRPEHAIGTVGERRDPL